MNLPWGNQMRTKVTERLTHLLGEGIDVHRCAAARALGVIGGPEATTHLVEALLDEDPDVRVDAADALAVIEDKATADKLMENLTGDPEGDVKKAAISALVAMRHAPLLPLLRSLAVSRSEEQVAWDEEAFYTDGWDAWDDVQLIAIRGLGAYGDEDGVDAILAALGDEMGQDVSEHAFPALARMGNPGAEALRFMYEDGHARLNRRIARAVGQSDNPKLEALRSQMLEDTSPAIRAVALEHLSSDDTRLAGMFGDKDAGVRAAVVRHHGAAHLAALRDLIKDAAPEVRIEVFKVIASFPESFSGKDDVDALKSTIKGDPEAARQGALALFALKGPKVAKGFTHVLNSQSVPREFRLGILETLEKAGAAAVPALLEVAGDPDRQMRLACLTTLANIAADDPVWPNDAGHGLLSALKGELVLPPEEPEAEEVAPEPDLAELEEIAREIDESLPLVAEDAAPGSTLQAIMANKPDIPTSEPPEIVLDEATQRLLDKALTRKFSKRKVTWATEVAPYLDVQRFSARLLGQVMQSDVTQALIAALKDDPDEELAQAILFSLAEHASQNSHLPETLNEILQAHLNSQTSEIRVLATRLIGFLPGDISTEMLPDLARHEDPLVRVEAIQALERRNQPDPVVTDALSDPYLGTGIAAARALARISCDTAVGDLIEFATRNDGIYRRDIGRLLGEYAPQKGAARLLDLLSNEDRKQVWLVAIDALAELFQTQSANQPTDQTRLVA
jgi:HEAT repeat protein